MTHERRPHTVHAWLSTMAEHGQSTRPVPPGISDLVDILQPDPEDFKSERGALGAIVSTRTYQRAKKLLIAQRERLASLSITEIVTIDDFITKNYTLGEAFKTAMVNSLLRDERLAKKLPDDHPVASAYHRLNEIVTPTLLAMSGEEKREILEKLGRPDLEMSGAFLEVQGGIAAQASDMNTLGGNIVRSYIRQFRKVPDVTTILEIMKNSYESYIETLANLHRVDSKAAGMAEEVMKSIGENPHELQDGALHFVPRFFEALKSIREKTKKERSRTITCPFKTRTELTQPFLDEPADFEDPLRDAFDLHIQLLSA